jgi:protein-tyrosine phosphatase
VATEEGRTRRLLWGDCYNVRDLGGHRTPDGRETAWGAVIRADSLSRLTPEGCDALRAYGVRTIVDLRLMSETAVAQHPFAPPTGGEIAYYNISLFDPAAGPAPAYATLADDYKGVLARFPDTIRDVMTTIARAPEGGVVVHCAGGRDRTGIVVALLLALAGVPHDAIAADYALSTEYLRPRDEEWLANGPGDRAERERSYARGLTKAEVMLEFLAHLDERHGGAEAYVLGIGVKPADIARLCTRLVSTPSGHGSP